MVRRERLRWSVLGGLAIGLLAATPGFSPLGTAEAAPAGFTCTIAFGSTPAALLIPNTLPGPMLPAGTNVSFDYEFRVVNYSGADLGQRVMVPTTALLLPKATGGNLEYYETNRTIAIPGPNWTNATAASSVHRVATTTQLATSGNSTLTTQKLAVMVTAGFGAVRLSFRWQWSVQYPNGSGAVGPWSHPNATAFHPTVFYAAPYVSLVGTSGSPATIGTRADLDLLGYISGQGFFLELENASTGLVVATRGVTAPAGNTTPFVASIHFDASTQNLTPGAMLVHVHNRCGSMLHSVSFEGVYARSASVRLLTNRATCSTVGFNGTTYAARTTVTAHPSTTDYPIRAPTCRGHAFTGWGAQGDLQVANPTAATTLIRVTYSGNLTADYA